MPNPVILQILRKRVYNDSTIVAAMMKRHKALYPDTARDYPDQILRDGKYYNVN